MQLKPGVRLTTLSPQMALAASIIDQVFARLDPNCSRTITSANDAKHSTGSLHYQGNALDWRTKDFKGSKRRLCEQVQAALGADFDVVLEDLGGVNEHLHTEYDPDEDRTPTTA